MEEDWSFRWAMPDRTSEDERSGMWKITAREQDRFHQMRWLSQRTISSHSVMESHRHTDWSFKVRTSFRKWKSGF
jgi:hypothetical protein